MLLGHMMPAKLSMQLQAVQASGILVSCEANLVCWSTYNLNNKYSAGFSAYKNNYVMLRELVYVYFIAHYLMLLFVALIIWS